MLGSFAGHRLQKITTFDNTHLFRGNSRAAELMAKDSSKKNRNLAKDGKGPSFFFLRAFSQVRNRLVLIARGERGKV